MKITIGYRGIIEDVQSPDSFTVEIPIRFVSAPLYVPVLVTSSAANVTSARTLINATTNCVLTLPDALTVDGQELLIKKLNASNFSVTINSVNNQTIDGQTSMVITSQNTVVTFLAFQGNWYIT